ncbi:hypothetical protein UJ101_01486 [Flavobacteriaceae bacterium UJ101]|nr:hypothetical protein UJ101_01486 [Flavobacteriaceae bacterium UJ101]
MKKSRKSTIAIERLYITMRHLFNRGFYKPCNASGQSLREMLLVLNPEIYGVMANKDKVELAGLTYVIDRLPEGIEECRFINLTSDEGYDKTHFEAIIPEKRRRNCYRIDKDQMNIEITRGRSEIYDILTHLTFMFNEASKIMNRAYYTEVGETSRAWKRIEEIALHDEILNRKDREVALMHLAGILGRTYEETLLAYKAMQQPHNKERFFKLIYWMGKLSIDEHIDNLKREISFSSALRDNIGLHFHGERWAKQIKDTLYNNNLIDRPLHIISANMHSVMNTLYARQIGEKAFDNKTNLEVYKDLSVAKNSSLRERVFNTALKKGMYYIKDESGSNINVQIFDLSKINVKNTPFASSKFKGNDVIIVMDYAFGEQAFEVMDELLKPYKTKKEELFLNMKSISIMGKAGILQGEKGDIMIPTSHILEGSADNYPFENALKVEDFKGNRIGVYEGAMISVMGTSLQNKDILEYFKESTWGATGLEMEGAHYQKAIQAAAHIRGHISPNVVVRYAYYASDNPLKTGSTLASGALGFTGVKPTYLITEKILEQIFV